MKQSQEQFVVERLKKDGFISRNFCLQNYITRLSAIIFMLKEAGWEFDTDVVDTTKPDGSKGKDFRYIVKSKPKERHVEIFVDEKGERKAREVWN